MRNFQNFNDYLIKTSKLHKFTTSSKSSIFSYNLSGYLNAQIKSNLDYKNYLVVNCDIFQDEFAKQIFNQYLFLIESNNDDLNIKLFSNLDQEINQIFNQYRYYLLNHFDFYQSNPELDYIISCIPLRALSNPFFESIKDNPKFSINNETQSLLNAKLINEIIASRSLELSDKKKYLSRNTKYINKKIYQLKKNKNPEISKIWTAIHELVKNYNRRNSKNGLNLPSNLPYVSVVENNQALKLAEYLKKYFFDFPKDVDENYKVKKIALFFLGKLKIEENIDIIGFTNELIASSSSSFVVKHGYLEKIDYIIYYLISNNYFITHENWQEIFIEHKFFIKKNTKKLRSTSSMSTGISKVKKSDKIKEVDDLLRKYFPKK